MGKSKYVEFVFNSMEPHEITGTNLYYLQTQSGVHKNGYDAFKDHLLKKLGSEPTQERHRKLRENAWVIYKKEEGETIDDFIEAIKNGTRQPIQIKRDGKPLDLFITPINQVMSADKNGNVLIKSMNSDLEDYSGVGDILLSRDGEVLHDTKGSACINKSDDNGYYRLDVFKSETSRSDGKKDIVQIDVNFLDPEGKKIRQDDFVVPKELPHGPQEIRYTRNYYAPNSKNKKERLGGMYPAGYIVFRENTDRNSPRGLKEYRPRIVSEFYPSASTIVSKIITDVEALKKAGIAYNPTFPRSINDYHKEAIARYNSNEYQALRQFFANGNVNSDTSKLYKMFLRENEGFRELSKKVNEIRSQQTQ